MQQFWGQNICFPTQSLSRDSPPINCFFHLASQPEICSSEPSSPARFQLCPSDDNKAFFFFKIKKKQEVGEPAGQAGCPAGTVRSVVLGSVATTLALVPRAQIPSACQDSTVIL